MIRTLSWLSATLTVAMCAASPLAFVPAPGSPFPAGKHPVSPILIDVDGDGALDIVVADSRSDTVTLLRGDGHGRFAKASQFTAMPSPHLVASGDFDDDGKPDLVVASHDSNSATILINRGGRFPESPRKLVTLFEGPRGHIHGLVVADIDGDGHDDITAGHQDLDAIALLRGKGDGTFHPARQIAAGRAPYPHALAEINGDSHADIIVPNVSGNAVTILSGRGDGRFDLQPPLPLGSRPFFVGVARLDRDRHPDLFVTHDDSNVATILFGNGKGQFRAARLDLGMRAGKIAIADVNGDSFSDVAVASDREARIFVNDGRGVFRLGKTLDGGGWEAELRDVNGDGRVDVIVPNGERGTVSVFLAR